MSIIEIKSKTLKITGYDLETTGVPEDESKVYQQGDNNIEKNQIIINDKIYNIYDDKNVMIDGKTKKIEYIKETDKEVKIKTEDTLLEIYHDKEKNEKTITKTILPGINSYGYISFDVETPDYIIDTETKTIKIKYKVLETKNRNLEIEAILEGNNEEYSYKEEIKEFKYTGDIKFKIDKKTSEKVIDSFSTEDGKQIKVKDNLAFEVVIKNQKETHTPLWNYFSYFKKTKQNNLFFSIPSYYKPANPIATALTRLYQLDNLKKITDIEEIKNWLKDFKSKIEQEEKDIIFPEINLNQSSDKIWDDFSKIFLSIQEYQAKELSGYPEISKNTIKELITEMENSDIVFGHNILKFDNPLVMYLDIENFGNLVDDIKFFDTMLIPTKLKGTLKVPNLNKAIGEVVKSSKLFDKDTKEYLEDIQELRKKYHDALLDIIGNFYPFADQMHEVYTKPHTEKLLNLIDNKTPIIPEIKVEELPNIDTIIGLPTDDKGILSSENIAKISDKYGYEKIGVSNYILSDFPEVNKNLEEFNKKSIITMKIDLEGEEVIVVLKSPQDQIQLEMTIDSNRNLTLERFNILLENEQNTMEFLVKPTFEDEYNIKSKKIGIRVDPFIEYDYDNTKFKNKRVLTISPIVDENDISNYKTAELYKIIKSNSISTGEIETLATDGWFKKNKLYGIPTKEELAKLFPPSKYKDIYKNANKIGETSITFDLYATNKRDEFPDLEKLFHLDLPKIDEELEKEIVKDLNKNFKNDNIIFEHNPKKGRIYRIKTNVSKEQEEEISKEVELLKEKVIWGKVIKNIEDEFMKSDRILSIHYNYILNDEYNENPYKVIDNFNEMDEEGKIQAIIDYVNENHNTDEMKEHLRTWEIKRSDRRKEENRVFNEMQKDGKLNTELSTFYHKYLLLNMYIQKEIYPNYGVKIGPGRGSAGGSEVAFELGITKTDPLRYNTLFFRFTHEFKTSKPDIDTDHNERTKALEAIESYMQGNYTDVEEYLKVLEIDDVNLLPEQKYFKNILNVVYFTRKTLYSGLMKSLRLSTFNSKPLENMFDETLTIRENIENIQDKRLKSYFSAIPGYIINNLDENARSLIRNMGNHASGNILFNKPYEKVYTSKNPIEEYGEKGEMPEKLDVLGLETLNILDNYQLNATIVEISDKYNLNLSIYQVNDFIKTYDSGKPFLSNFSVFAIKHKIEIEANELENLTTIYNKYEIDYIFPDYTNTEIIDMLKDGKSGGVFQMDGRTQRKLLRSLFKILSIAKKANLDEFKNINIHTMLTIINAVNRPGPLTVSMDKEIITNFENDLLKGLKNKGYIKEIDGEIDLEYLEDIGIEDKDPLYRKAKTYLKKGSKEFYETKDFQTFWQNNIESDLIAIKNGDINSGLIYKYYIEEEKSIEEIIEIFQSFEEKMKNIEIIKEMLSYSNGAILYQEQIMELAKNLGGLDVQDVDNLRKAVAKSNPEKIMKYINLFVAGAEKKGIISGEIAEYLGIKFKGFGAYAFNLSHSSSYSQVSFASSLRKAENPAMFYAANFNFSKMENVGSMIDEIERSEDFKLITGNINQAVDTFTAIDKQTIIIPLTAYKRLDEKVAKKIIEELTNGKPFTSVYNLLYRTLPDMNKGSFEVLLKSGLLTDFIQKEGLSVKSVVENVDLFFAELKDYYKKNDNKEFINIEKIEKEINEIKINIQELEDKIHLYANPIEIEIEMKNLKEKLKNKDEELNKSIEKNHQIKLENDEKLLKGEIDTNLGIKDILNKVIYKKVLDKTKKDITSKIIKPLKEFQTLLKLSELETISPLLDKYIEKNQILEKIEEIKPKLIEAIELPKVPVELKEYSKIISALKAAKKKNKEDTFDKIINDGFEINIETIIKKKNDKKIEFLEKLILDLDENYRENKEELIDIDYTEELNSIYKEIKIPEELKIDENDMELIEKVLLKYDRTKEVKPINQRIEDFVNYLIKQNKFQLEDKRSLIEVISKKLYYKYISKIEETSNIEIPKELKIEENDLKLVEKMLEKYDRTKETKTINQRIEDFVDYLIKQNKFQIEDRTSLIELVSKHLIEKNNLTKNKNNFIDFISSENIKPLLSSFLTNKGKNIKELKINFIKEIYKENNLNENIELDQLQLEKEIIKFIEETNLNLYYENILNIQETTSIDKEIFKLDGNLNEFIKITDKNRKELTELSIEYINEFNSDEKINELKSVLISSEDYTENELNENRYVLLRNFNPETIKIDLQDLKTNIFSEEKVSKILEFSNSVFNGEETKPFDLEFEEKYEIRLEDKDKLSKVVWTGNRPKFVVFTDYIPNEKDVDLEEITLSIDEEIPKTFIDQNNITYQIDDPNAKYKNYYPLNNGKLDKTIGYSLRKKKDEYIVSSYGKPTNIECKKIIEYTITSDIKTYFKDINDTYKSFKSKKEDGSLNDYDKFNIRYDSYKNKFIIKTYGVEQDNMKVLGQKGIPKWQLYLTSLLESKGLSLNDVIVLPAYPFTKETFDNLTNDGVKINLTDNLFISRYKNICEQNELDFVVLMDTMVNNVTKKYNLAGRDTDIEMGRPFIMKFGEQKVSSILIPTVARGMKGNEANKNALDSFAEIIDDDGTSSKTIGEKYSIEPEEELDIEKDNDIIIDAEIIEKKGKGINL